MRLVKANESARSRLEVCPMTHVQCELATAALAGLLIEFRHGNIVALSAEEKGMERHAGSLSARWNDRFPGFPIDHFPYTLFCGEYYRRHRDAHLNDIIVELLADRGDRPFDVPEISRL
jgi:hypothetical protein